MHKHLLKIHLQSLLHESLYASLLHTYKDKIPSSTMTALQRNRALIPSSVISSTPNYAQSNLCIPLIKHDYVNVNAVWQSHRSTTSQNHNSTDPSDYLLSSAIYPMLKNLFVISNGKIPYAPNFETFALLHPRLE